MTHDDAIKLIETDETKSVKREGWVGTAQKVWHVYKNSFQPWRRSLLWLRLDGSVQSWAETGPADDKAATDWVANYPETSP